MGLGGLASALAKGINGYTRGTMLKDEKERQDKEDAFKATERARTLKTWEREDALHAGLNSAMKPAKVDTGFQIIDSAGSDVFTQDAEAAAVLGDMAKAKNDGVGLSQATRVNQDVYTSPAEAKKAADAYNSPKEQSLRMAAVMAPTDPKGSGAMQATALGLEKTQMEIDAARSAAARQAKKEGYEGVFKALATDDPQAIFDAGNLTGDYKFKEPPRIVGAKKVKTPWGTEIEDKQWEGVIVGPDGKEAVRQFSRFQLGQHLASVSDLLKDESEAQKMGLSHAQKLEQLKAASGGIKAPSGYRWKADGTLEPTPGGPADKVQQTKPLPTSAAGGLISNVQNLRRAKDALALLSGQNLQSGAVGDPQATGLKGVIPNQVLNRMDPKGVDTRAAIADLGSLVIHDRSGAAVTAAEFPRLAPFIPTPTDSPDTAAKKLRQFVANYEATVEDTAEFYRASGYNVPTETLRTSNAEAPKGGRQQDVKIPRVSSFAEAMKMPSGTVFMDPNGVKRKVP